MAKGLEDLTNYVLENIAIDGSEGATFEDVVKYTKNFYLEGAIPANGIGFDKVERSTVTNSFLPSVDRTLLAKVWAHLAKNSDVSIGRDHEFDLLTLNDIEKRYPGYTLIDDQEPHRTSPSSFRQQSEPRIFIDDERIYLIICGHPPDVTRVFPSEFPLLIAIAATRDNGILQGDLCRATGQDKRSVPKRTDRLHEKGYIVKKNVWTGGHKTSRLYLRRFASSSDQDLSDRFTAKNRGNNRSIPEISSTVSELNGTASEVRPDRHSRPQANHDNVEVLETDETHDQAGDGQASGNEVSAFATTAEDSAQEPDDAEDGFESDDPGSDTLPQPLSKSTGVRRKSSHTSMPKAKSQNRKPGVIRGRPRKFMKGTEKFWRQMFLTAKLQVDPNYPPKIGSAGLMIDPVGLEMYNNRPIGFDETLSKAIQDDLPVPSLPQEITQDWIDKTNIVLQREERGLYLTPPGRPYMTIKGKSQVMILRSERLNTVDLYDRTVTPTVLSNTSNAAHSFRAIRYYPRMGETPAEVVDSLRLSKDQPPPRKRRKVQKDPEGSNFNQAATISTNPSSDTGPSRGVFFDEHIHSEAVGNEKSDNQRQRSYSIGDSTDQTASESAFPSRRLSSLQPERPDADIPFGSPSQARRVSLNQPSTSQNSNGRPTRSRKPTQKAAEAVERQKRVRRASSETDEIILVEITSKESQNNAIAGVAHPQHIQKAIESKRGGLEIQSEQSPSLEQDQGSRDPAEFQDTLNDIQTPSRSTYRPPDTTFVTTNGVEDFEGPLPTKNYASSNANTDRNFLGPPVIAEDGLEASRDQEYDSQSTMNKETPIKHPKFRKGRDAVNQYRRFVMELVDMCSGVAPNDHSMFKRAMKPKCQEANIDSDPNAKLIKSAMKSLCDGGKLKTMYFSFNREGIMITKSVIALPEITGLDDRFQELQENIKKIPTGQDYFPPELWAESLRAPNLSSTRLPSSSPEPHTPRRMPQRQRRATSFRRRRSDATPSTSDGATSTPLDSVSGLNTGFLTLKVANIRKIETATTFSTHYYALPPISVHIRGDRASTNQTQRRSSTRQKDSQVSSENKPKSQKPKIRWTQHSRARIPTSLEAILAQTAREDKTETEMPINDLAARFERQVDTVATWEQNNADIFFNGHNTKWTFINHILSESVFVTASVSGSLDFLLVAYNEEGEETERPTPPPLSWKPFVDALTEVSSESVALGRGRRRARREISFENVDDDEDSDFNPIEPKHPKNNRQKRIRLDESDESDSSVVIEVKQPIRRTRGPRALANISEEVRHRVCVAIICVRTLAGGLERYIDWTMICRLLPDYEEKDIKVLWRALTHKYLADIDSLVDSLQSKYLTALAADQVPSVDFENLMTTDWDGILSWALHNLDTSSIHEISKLAATRQDLHSANRLEVEERKGIRELYSHGMLFTQAMKESAFASTIFGTPVKIDGGDTDLLINPLIVPETESFDHSFVRAKSCIWAIVITPKESFEPMASHNKLLTLAESAEECESLVERVLNTMQRDKMIVKKSENSSSMSGTLGPQGWAVHPRFYDQFEFRRAVTANMLRQAAQYKINVLDGSFARGLPVEFHKNQALEDGEMVAILNLMSMGMIRVIPGRDVPASRYGLDWQNQGYKTKSMDKDAISFGVAAGATSTYILGDPLESAREQLVIPQARINEELGHDLIPAWYDINGHFRPELWEMFVGTVIGLISLRPGVSELELSRTILHCLTVRDIALIIGFLEECGSVTKTCSGWETTEWWWLSVGKGVKEGGTWNA